MSCWDRSLGIISRREHSVQELRAKLKEREYTPEQIDETIVRLLDRKFLDDERCFDSRCRMLIQRRYGRRRVQSDIARRGLVWNDERFDEILNEIDPDYIKNSIDELLEKKTRTPSFQKKLQAASNDRRMAYRLQSLCMNHLVMKGFAMGEAIEASRRFVNDLITKLK